MKATLRKVDKGIIATIDERPGDKDLFFYDVVAKDMYTTHIDYECHYDKYDHKIIASNFGVGMELCMLLSKEMDLLLPIEDCLHFDYDTEYSYSIVDGKVVVEL